MSLVIAIPALIGLATAYCWIAGVVYGKLLPTLEPCNGTRGHGPYSRLPCNGPTPERVVGCCLPCGRRGRAKLLAWLWPIAPVLLAFRAGQTVFGWGSDVTVTEKQPVDRVEAP